MMTIDELTSELRAILAAEEQMPPDWRQVETRSLRVIERLSTEEEPAYPDEMVYHFLDDPDVRQKSAPYAERQRERLREWLASR